MGRGTLPTGFVRLVSLLRENEQASSFDPFYDSRLMPIKPFTKGRYQEQDQGWIGYYFQRHLQNSIGLVNERLSHNGPAKTPTWPLLQWVRVHIE